MQQQVLDETMLGLASCARRGQGNNFSEFICKKPELLSADTGLSSHVTQATSHKGHATRQTSIVGSALGSVSEKAPIVGMLV